jgi:hypothetical protein
MLRRFGARPRPTGKVALVVLNFFRKSWGLCRRESQSGSHASARRVADDQSLIIIGQERSGRVTQAGGVRFRRAAVFLFLGKAFPRSGAKRFAARGFPHMRGSWQPEVCHSMSDPISGPMRF